MIACLRRTPAVPKKKLSYQEGKELAGIEDRITEAELELQICHKALEDPEVMGDHVRLQNVLAEMARAQKTVDALYALGGAGTATGVRDSCPIHTARPVAASAAPSPL